MVAVDKCCVVANTVEYPQSVLTESAGGAYWQLPVLPHGMGGPQ